jgi:hypothetical protein
VFKGLLYEAMNVIGWCYATKGPNLHVVQAHLGKNPMVLHVVIFRANRVIKQLQKKPKNLSTCQL